MNTDYAVANFDKLTYAGNLESLADIADNPATSSRYTFIHGDIADRPALDRAFTVHQPVAVLHLAAESHVDRSIDGPAEFIQTNVVGTYTLLETARNYWQQLAAPRKETFRFLHVSTDEVYGSLDLSPSPQDAGEEPEDGQPYTAPTSDRPFTEKSRYDPHSPYAATKAASDHLARAWHATYGLPVVVTNCSNNYGPYQFPEKLIPVVIATAIAGEPIPVYGRGENVRDWLHVEDHCAALVRVLDRGALGRTYNIGGNNERSNLQLVQTLCGILDEMRPRPDGQRYAEQITFVADRPGHDLRYAIDASRMADELDWRPTHNHETGFRTTVEWYLDNELWWQRVRSGGNTPQRQGKYKLESKLQRPTSKKSD